MAFFFPKMENRKAKQFLSGKLVIVRGEGHKERM
jgi:hypothetical protein